MLCLSLWSGTLGMQQKLQWRPRTRVCIATWPQSSSSSCSTAYWSRTASPRPSTPTTSKGPYCGKQVGWHFESCVSSWGTLRKTLCLYLTVYLNVCCYKDSKESRSPTCWSRRPAAWHVACASCFACTRTRAARTPGRKSRDGCSSKQQTHDAFLPQLLTLSWKQMVVSGNPVR